VGNWCAGVASLVIGFGRAAPMGVAWAATVFASEAAFTLLALPVLPAHGAWGVSVRTTWMAAALFAMLSLVVEGPSTVLRLGVPELLAVLCLVLATSIAFLYWFSCVAGLGPARAGLLTGIVPVTAALTGALLGGPLPNPLAWAGIVVVGGGLALGLAHAQFR
jgi:drug/metabolite transporter (DMT)-like permease